MPYNGDQMKNKKKIHYLTFFVIIGNRSKYLRRQKYRNVPLRFPKISTLQLT